MTVLRKPSFAHALLLFCLLSTDPAKSAVTPACTVSGLQLEASAVFDLQLAGHQNNASPLACLDKVVAAEATGTPLCAGVPM